MQEPFIYTGNRPDSTRWDIPLIGFDRAPVESPKSRSTLLTEIFQNAIRSIPTLLPTSFPLKVEDARIASRMKNILGIPQEGGQPYLVLGKTVNQWIKEFETIIGKPFIEAEYIVGSSTTFIAGQPLHREALDVFLKNFRNDDPQKGFLFAKISRKISHKTFHFSDVDLRIKVNKDFPLDLLQSNIQYRTDLFDGKVLIIYIGEKEKNALDIVVYKELDTESAFNIDDLKIDILKSDLDNNRVVFESSHPWEFWMGQTLGILENYTTDGFRSFPRLLKQTSMGKRCLKLCESLVFHEWKNKVSKSNNALKRQCDNQQANHERHVPLADILLRLRMQQLILLNAPESKFLLREAANTEVPASAPSIIKAIFYAMQEKGADIASIHRLIECIALLAVYDAWQKPFEVKFVMHEEKWLLRIRFRGTFGKRDLLVRFDFDGCMTFIRSASLQQWEKMREIIHALWFDGTILQRRFDEKNTQVKYRKLFPVPLDATEIKRKFLSLTKSQKNEELVNSPPLALTEIESHSDPKILGPIFHLVLNHYFHDLDLRNQLCWKIIDKCIEIHAFSAITDMIIALRKKKIEPSEGYTAFFAHLVLKGCDSYLLYQACNPFPSSVSEENWLKLVKLKDKAKFFVVTLMNELDISAEMFLEMTQLLKIPKPDIEEKILYKIILLDRNEACQWIIDKDRNTFSSENYKQEVSHHILEKRDSFKPVWIKDFLLSKRFLGSQENLVSLCEYLVSKPIEVSDKAVLLQTCAIKDAALWQKVAEEYLSKGVDWSDELIKVANFDCETLVKCQEIIENADKSQLVSDIFETIKAKILPPVRICVIVRILKNWKNKQASADVLTLIDPSPTPLPWKTIIHEAKAPEAILTKLITLKGALPWYSSLFRLLKPKDLFFTTCWVNKVLEVFPVPKTDKLLSDFKRLPFMTECLHVNQQACLPIFKRMAASIEGIDFILENLEEADIEILKTMIQTSLQFDQSTTGGKVFSKFFNSDKHKKRSLMEPLAILAKKILQNPEGDSKIAGDIWKIVKDAANPDLLPSKEHIKKLINHGYTDWVIDLFNKAKKEDLESIGADIYCRLLKSIKDFENKCVILVGCPIVSAAIEMQWEKLVEREDLIDSFSATKLMKCAQTLRVSDAKIQKFVLAHLTKCDKLEDHVLKYLTDMISRLDHDNAYRLWETLQRSKRIENVDLWESGFHILNQNPHTPHHYLLKWLEEHCPSKYSERFLSLISKIAENPIEEQSQIMLLKFVKQELAKNSSLAREVYWKLDCDENISVEEVAILRPTEAECILSIHRLVEKQMKEGISPNLFKSTMFFYAVCRLPEDDRILDVLDFSIFKLIATHLHGISLDEKIFWISRLGGFFIIDKFDMSTNSDMLQIYKFILDYPETITDNQKLTLLYNMIQQNLMVDEAWKLIGSLASSDNENHFSCILLALDKIENIDCCPVKVFFKSKKFPHYFNILLNLCDKIKDPIRKDYIRASLLGTIMKVQPSKDMALKFFKFIPLLYAYLEKHKEKELQDWQIFKVSKKAKMFEVQQIKGPGTAEDLFYLFVSEILDNPSIDFLYDTEVLIAYQEKISKFHTSLELGLFSIIMRNSFDKESIEAASIIVTYVFENLVNAMDKKISINNEHTYLIRCILRRAGELIIKFSPRLNDWSLPCATDLYALCDNSCPVSSEERVKCLSIYMGLQGTLSSFPHSTIIEQSEATFKAIAFLCIHPHSSNLESARRLLHEGTPESLFLFNNDLLLANNAYAKSSLGNASLQNLPGLLPHLFSHLCGRKTKIECFEMDDQQTRKHLEAFYEKTSSPIEYTFEADTATIANIRKNRLTLISSNIIRVLEFFPSFDACLVSFLNHWIFPFLVPQDIAYEQWWNVIIDQFIRIITSESQRNNPSNKILIQEFAALLCCHSFLPINLLCSRWMPEILLKYIIAARNYDRDLNQHRGNLKEIIELIPENYDTTLGKDKKSADEEVVLRYQWLLAAIDALKQTSYTKNTTQCTDLIHDELIKCLRMAPKMTTLASINLNILNIIEDILDYIGEIGKIDSVYCNNWYQMFLINLKSNWCEENAWIYSLIEEKLQLAMTIELLPSLPLLEAFSGELSVEHKDKTCIDAYGKLISLKCQEDHVIQRAVGKLRKLKQKIRFMSNNSIIDQSITNSEYIIFQDMEAKLLIYSIYFTGLSRILTRLHNHKDNDRFIHEFLNFRAHTDTYLQENNISSDFLNIALRLFFENLEMFTDSRVITEILEYVVLIKEMPKLTLLEYTRYETQFALLGIFLGPKNTKEDNLYICKFIDDYENPKKKIHQRERNFIDLNSIENHDFLSLIVLATFISDHNLHAVNLFQTRASHDPKFRDHYRVVLNHLKSHFERFIEIRPDYKLAYLIILRRVKEDLDILQEYDKTRKADHLIKKYLKRK